MLFYLCFSRLVVAEMFVWAFSRDPSVSVETTCARLRNRPGVAVHETAGNGGVGVQDVSIISLIYLASHDITMVWFTLLCCFSAVLTCSNPPAHTSCQRTGSKRKGTAGVAVELKANYKLPCLSRSDLQRCCMSAMYVQHFIAQKAAFHRRCDSPGFTHS